MSADEAFGRSIREHVLRWAWKDVRYARPKKGDWHLLKVVRTWESGRKRDVRYVVGEYFGLNAMGEPAFSNTSDLEKVEYWFDGPVPEEKK